MKKQILLLMFWLLFVISLSVFTQVSAREWEVGWPDLPGIVSPSNLPPEEKLTLDYFVTYVFSFALMLIGMVALLMLIINAIRYMAATALPGGKAAALEQFRNIGFGVLLLLGAYIFLSTINPELVVFGVKSGEFVQATLPTGVVTLYKVANCTGDQISKLSYDEDLTDNTGDWNDKTVSFQISNNSVARICHDSNYGDCTMYLGDGTCLDAAAQGFTPDQPRGISSIKVEGLVDSVHLVLFERVDFGGESKSFTATGVCTAVGSNLLGTSYWVAPNKKAILCRTDNWNACTRPEITGLASNPNTGGSYASVCVFDNTPPSCVGVFLYNGASDFVPAITYCKDLSSGNTTGNASGVGPGCRVNICDETGCTGNCVAWPDTNPPGIDGASAGTLVF